MYAMRAEFCDFVDDVRQCTIASMYFVRVYNVSIFCNPIHRLVFSVRLIDTNFVTKTSCSLTARELAKKRTLTRA